MNPERWQRVKEVYHSALERDPAERDAFLAGMCRHDSELRREVESLLAQSSTETLLERPAWQAAANKETASQPSAIDPMISPVRRQPFLWIVRITAVALALLFVYVAWILTQENVPGFGWSEGSFGGDYSVTAVDPAQLAAGRLMAGDRLVSLNGDPNVARAGTGPYRRSIAIGDRYQLRIIRGGQTHDYTLSVAPGDRRLASRASFFFMGMIWCVVALFIGFSRPGDTLARLAFAAATSTGLVLLTVGNLPGFRVFQPLHVVIGYHFFYQFPGGPPRRKIWKVLLSLLYAGIALRAPFDLQLNWISLTQGPAQLTAWFARPVFAMDVVFANVVFGCAVVAAVAMAVYKYRVLSDPDQRRRFRWVAYGGVAGLAPSILYSLLNLIRRGAEDSAVVMSPQAWFLFSLWVNGSSVVIPICVAYAVVKHRVFDIRVAVRLGLQYLLARRALRVLFALPSLALLYTAVAHRHQTIGELVTGNREYLLWMLALGLSLKFRVPLGLWLDRKFFREQYDREQVILGLAADLGKLNSMPEVTDLVSMQLERALHPKSMYLWWYQGRVLKLSYSSDPSLENTESLFSRPLLLQLEQPGAILDVPLPADSGVSRSESRWFQKLGVELLVPITGSSGELNGVLMLGEKKSEEPYSASDRRLLHGVAKQTAVFAENLRLKAQVHEEQRIRHDVLAKLDRDLIHLLKECPVCGACFDSDAVTCDRDGNPLTLSLPVSRTIDQKYRLLQLIGKGGMGAVYEARDLRLDRPVAVKIMLGRAFGQETDLRRFRREAHAAARLNHPNIVSVYDIGSLDGGGAYLVMERLRGPTLRAEIKRVGKFSPSGTSDWLAPLLDGLAAAHQQGIIHRDLKPENVIGQLGPAGSLSVKILDFGLAKVQPLATAAGASHSLTESGIIMGTVAYMSPEQLRGERVDQRSDIFAIGVILVEMLAGQRPFLSPAASRDAYDPASTFPARRALVDLLQRCLALDPADRFSSAAELRKALVPALAAP